MKITGTGTVRATPPRRAGRAATAPAGPSFASAMPSETSSAAPTSTGAPVGSLDSLLAVQEIVDRPGGDGEGRRRGEYLLDRLDELRLGLLDGAISRHKLHQLRATIDSERGRIDDPRLAAVLDEIEVRAAVELAKLDFAT